MKFRLLNLLSQFLTFHPQAKKDLKAIFEALPEEEQNLILDPRGLAKLPTKHSSESSVIPAKDIGVEPKESPQQVKKQKKKAENAENDVVRACDFSYFSLLMSCLAL